MEVGLLVIPHRLMEEIRRDIASRPRIEACGLLTGHLASNEARVQRVHPLPNILDHPTRFELDPRDIYRVWTVEEKAGRGVIGVYHSHPPGYPARPSPWDRPYLQEGGLPWLILSGREARGWMWRGGDALEIEVRRIR